MKTTRRIDDKGNVCSTNPMLDNVIDIIEEEYGISNDELIKRLTIDKIEYGRRCTAQAVYSILNENNETKEKVIERYNSLDEKLVKIINELGG